MKYLPTLTEMLGFLVKLLLANALFDLLGGDNKIVQFFRNPVTFLKASWE